MRSGLILLVGLMLLVACGSMFAGSCCDERPSAEKPAVAPEVKEHKVAPEEVGLEVICPVMGTKFKVKATTQAAEYKGKVYYFCCGGCPAKFKADPEKYVTKKEEPAAHH